jgi:DNA-binding transcriptional LysR family regulator
LREKLFDIDGHLLLTLDALLRDQNVTHAATRLGISQSALSGRLARLRQHFGDQLLVPAASGRGMIPTPHAHAIQPALLELIYRLREFSNVASVFDPATSQRTFRIAATDNPAAILAPDLIPFVKAHAPHVRLAFVFPDKPSIFTDLEQGRFDLFVGAVEDGAGGLMSRTLLDDHFVTAQRIDHPRGREPFTLDEFCSLDHLLISTAGGRFSGAVDAALATLGRERRVSVSIQSYALAPVILASSDHICTLPHRFLARFAGALDLFEPPLALERFNLSAFWHDRTRNDPAHVWLREQVFRVASAQGRADL